MGSPESNKIDSMAGPAWAAMLSTVLAQCLSSKHSERWSETLCWMMLPTLFNIAKRSKISAPLRETLPPNSKTQPASSGSLWILAVCITVASYYKAKNRTIVLFPALTPLLLIAQEHLQSGFRAPRTSDSWGFRPLVDTIWGTALVAAFTILTLSKWDLKGSILSTIPATTLLLVYVALIPRSVKSTYLLPLLNIEHAIVPLSMRVVVILTFELGMETVVFGFPKGGIAPTIISGLAKASSWYFTIITTRSTSWSVATAIETFSITSTKDPFRQSSEVQALLHVVASFLAVGQVVHTIPKQAKGRTTLWALSLIFIVPYLANVYFISAAQSSAQQSFRYSREHPVDVFFDNAKADFENLLQMQSQSYTAAQSEYQRRYGMKPPPGFKTWYEFAKLHNSPIIDDFDMIYDSISPFWKLSGLEVLQIMTHVQNVPNNELWLCAISGHRAKIECSHPYRTFDRHIQSLFDSLVGALRDILPDVNFLVNHFDEPRVLIPLQLGELEPHGNRLLNMTDMSHRPVFDTVTRYCASQGSNRNTKTKHPVNTFGLPFVSDSTSAMDLCQHPAYSKSHGLFMGPTSFHLIEGLVPVLSTGSLSTMGDILYPSASSIEPEFQYTEAHDIEWDSKRNNLYWSGSTTGGFVSDDSWPHYHRQRFVRLAQNLEKHQHYYLRKKDGLISRVKSSFLNSRLFDVAFTRIFQCERKFCRDQVAYFDVMSWADKDRALRSRLVFDIDGNGISGRYYKLLASRSAPLKQTLLREWHDERLVPWLHYIPVSQSMEELPELVSYLTSTRAGRQRAKEVAQYGRHWFTKAFRDIDRSIYTYRLLLELARLQDPERPAGGS